MLNLAKFFFEHDFNKKLFVMTILSYLPQKFLEHIGPYSVQSTLIISPTQDDDRGVYKCTGVTNNGTSTVTFSLHVESEGKIILANYLYFAAITDVPVPYLHLFLFDSNATSVIIAWEAFGVSDSANITVR